MSTRDSSSAGKPASEPANAAPIVINLGKVRGGRIKKLEKGEGPLLDEVNEVMEQVRAQLGESAREARLVPVVMVYRKKPRKRRSLLPLGL